MLLAPWRVRHARSPKGNALTGLLALLAIVVLVVAVFYAFLQVGHWLATSRSIALSSPEQPKAIIDLPRSFVTQCMDLLKTGEELCAATAQGVNRKDFSDRLITFKASFSLWKSLQPTQATTSDTLSQVFQATKALDEAISAWDLALKGWHEKEDLRIRAVEGSSVWRQVVTLTNNGEGIEVQVWKDNDGNRSRYIYLGDAVPALLKSAHSAFGRGKAIVLGLRSQSR